MSMNFQLPLASRLYGRLYLLMAALALFTLAGWSQEYTLTNLGTLGGSSSSANAVNDQGQVVGAAAVLGDAHSDPFIYSKGTMKDVWPSETEYGGWTVDINNDGHFIVNDFVDASGDTESYLWNGTNWVDLGTGGAVSMNASDMVVGNVWYEGWPYTYWVYANGQLNGSPGYALAGPSAIATAVNGAGWIAGMCANPDPDIYSFGCVFGQNVSPYAISGIWQGGLPAIAINSSGATCSQDGSSEFAIFSNNGTETVYFIYGSNPTLEGSWCQGLDDYGDAVGGYITGNNNDTRALIYDPVNGPRDLNKLIPKLSVKGHSVVIENAVSISDTGYIAANCLYAEGHAASQTRACLLTPNPVLILKDNINELGKGDPECIQCKEELVPLADSLPESLTDLSVRERRKVLATVEEMERRLQELLRSRKITETKEMLLLHDAELVQNAVDPRSVE
jgi:uncharacterized membrane protein